MDAAGRTVCNDQERSDEGSTTWDGVEAYENAEHGCGSQPKNKWEVIFMLYVGGPQRLV